MWVRGCVRVSSMQLVVKSFEKKPDGSPGVAEATGKIKPGVSVNLSLF
jgi:hypothetical protein